MLRNKTHRYRMALEHLEDKRLLAGDVSVNVIDGSLVIRGDMEANGVAVTAGDMRGEFIIAGLPVGDAATSINGVFDRVVVSGISRGMHLALGDGDDLANVFDVNVRGNVSIQAGAGDDHVRVGGPRRDAADSTEIATRIGGRLLVDLGSGNDRLLVTAAALGRGLDVDGGAGDDDVAITDSRSRGFVGIRTGAGEDRVVIEGTRAGLARIGTGAGADHVALVDSAFSGVSVHAGDGDDRVELAGIRARAAWFQGGMGGDGLSLTGPNHIGQFRVSGFETIHGEAGGTATDVLEDMFADGHEGEAGISSFARLI